MYGGDMGIEKHLPAKGKYREEVTQEDTEGAEKNAEIFFLSVLRVLFVNTPFAKKIDL